MKMKNISKHLLGIGFVAGTLMAGQVHAAPVGLAIVLDESGSISATDWSTQVTGYTNVLSGSLIQTNSSIVIGVWKFGSAVQQVFAPTLIDSAATKNLLITAISGMTRETTGGTAIGDGITAAYTAFDTLFDLNIDFSKMVIDVSTDGGNNTGLNPTTASNNALAVGVDDVNCLGVGSGADCTWNPVSSLDFSASSYSNFEAVLSRKIAVETGQVPEPASLALIGLGLFGINLARITRRNRKL